jgi:hypothetical protein
MGTPSFQALEQELRFSGHWIVGAQGSGKTNLLVCMIAADLPRDASIIVMDSKGDLTDEVRHLNLGSRLIVLDPEKAPFALNPLDVEKADIKRAVNQVEYIFGAMLEASVTPKQKGLLRSLLRACVMGIPNSTVLTIQDLIISGPENYRHYIQHLPPDLQHLFDTSKNGEWHSYDATLNELKWRMRLLLESDLIKQIFLAPKTRFRIADAMDNGNVLVIDNSEAKLHKDGSAFLGRYFIAQIWGAATARSGRQQHQKKPVYVYIDEADTVIDSTVAEIIDRCRSQRIALILAHQRVRGQIDDTNVLAALENCAIKMVNVKAEAPYFSKLMDIPEERIKSLNQGFFATEMRGHPPSIIQVPKASIPYRTMTASEEAALQVKMREKYGIRPDDSSPAQPPPPPPPNASPRTPPPPPPPRPNEAQNKPAPSAPRRDEAKLRDRTGALDWEVTISPRIAEAGGEVPLVVQRAGQPVKINVKIPALTKNNTVFRLAGLGHFRPDKSRGDLYLTIKVPPYPEQNTDWADQW